MTTFSPYSALAGGVLIGVAAVLLLALNGRIAGVSGVLSGLFSRGGPADNEGKLWRIAFLGGLVVGAGAYVALNGGLPFEARAGFSERALVIAGVLVGYGTSLAGGCTSGHGVCGLARFSVRSLVAVAVFLSVALATTFITRHVLGVPV